jgi:hypothetical protein
LNHGRRQRGARDIATEVVRRATAAQGQDGGYAVRLSNPPTPQERLQLLAARLQGTPIAIMPHPCKSTDEWVAR